MILSIRKCFIFICLIIYNCSDSGKCSIVFAHFFLKFQDCPDYLFMTDALILNFESLSRICFDLSSSFHFSYFFNYLRYLVILNSLCRNIIVLFEFGYGNCIFISEFY